MSCIFIHSASAGSTVIARKDIEIVVDSEDDAFELPAIDALHGVERPGDIACEFFHDNLPFSATFDAIARQPFALRAADGADGNAEHVSRKYWGVESVKRIVCRIHEWCIGAA